MDKESAKMDNESAAYVDDEENDKEEQEKKEAKTPEDEKSDKKGMSDKESAASDAVASEVTELPSEYVDLELKKMKYLEQLDSESTQIEPLELDKTPPSSKRKVVVKKPPPVVQKPPQKTEESTECEIGSGDETQNILISNVDDTLSERSGYMPASVVLVADTPIGGDKTRSEKRKKTKKKKTGGGRAQWGKQTEFLLSCVGYAIGLGNVWRFPYLCHKHGGGVFLIPYFISMLLLGLPMLYLELILGQFVEKGANVVFSSMTPLFSGVGWAMISISFMVNLYYNHVLAWILTYLVLSFRSELLWANCKSDWNTQCTAVSLFVMVLSIFRCLLYASYVILRFSR